MWSAARLTRSLTCTRVVLLALVVTGCSSAKLAPEPAAELAPSAATRWQPAVSAREHGSLEAPARVLAGPDDAALVGVPLVARVVKVRVRPGDIVAQGDPLVDVVMPELIRAAGLLRSAQIRLEMLEQQRARLEPLLAAQLALASDLVAVRSELALARAQREDARSTLRAAGQPDESAAALLRGNGAVSLRAPIAATVVAVSVQLGQLREPASGALVELAASAPLPQIEARFATLPAAGAEFEWVEPGRSLPLELQGVAPRAGALDGSKLAWLRTREGSVHLEPGALGRVRVLAPPEWVVVPTRALVSYDGTFHVAVQTPEGQLKVPVTIVQRSASEVIVTGLRVGALVASDASYGAGPRAP